MSFQAKGSCSPPLAASARPPADFDSQGFPGENVVFAESGTQWSGTRDYAMQLHMEKGCVFITSGDMEPVAPFDAVNSPAELGAECPGSPKKAVNSL